MLQRFVSANLFGLSLALGLLAAGTGSPTARAEAIAACQWFTDPNVGLSCPGNGACAPGKICAVVDHYDQTGTVILYVACECWLVPD